MEIKTEDLVDVVAEKVSEEILRNFDVLDEVRSRVTAKVDAAFAGSVDDIIQKAVDDSISNGFEREYMKVNTWGEPQGGPTTVKKELERITSEYWVEKVDGAGKKSNAYNAITRSEYIMNKICADDVSKELETNVTNITGHIKDGLRDVLRHKMDGMLDGLFKVRSLQDQGKVKKTP